MEFLSKQLPVITNRRPDQWGRFVCMWWIVWLSTSLSQPLFAQVFPLQIQVNVMPPYSAYLQDYPGTGQQVRVFIINTSRTTYQIRLMGQLTGDNGIDIRTSPNYRPPRPVTIPPGQTLLTRNDLEGLFDLNQVEVTGIDKNLLSRGFPLPDGTYQLCVRAYNETPTNTAAVAFGQPLSAEFPIGCSAPIVVRSVEPPILISPFCDATVSATMPQAMVFTWTPPAGVSPASVEYTLRVVELPQTDVDPNVFIDAIALPKSGVEIRNLRTSTFLYGPTQPPLQVGKRYAWRVQAIDRSRKLNFQNDGKSPVCAFTYGASDTLSDKKPVAYVYKSGEIGASCSCKYTFTGSKDITNKQALEAGKATVAGFPITFLKTADGVKEVDGVLTGNATIPMPIVNNPYFKLRVQLVNVQCNEKGEVINGYVQAVRSNKFPSIFPAASKPSVKPPGMPTISTENADSVGAQVQKLSDQLKAFPGQLLSQAGEVAKSVGMEVPFGIDKSLGPISTNIAITDVIFTAEDAYFNATTFIEAPGMSAQFNGIPLAGYHICIKPDGTCGDKVLYLAKDMLASSLLTLKGGAVALKILQNKVTHVVFDENGFKTLHVSAGINTPGLLRKSNDPATNGQPLELLATFDMPSADLPKPDFKNWTAKVQTEDDFYASALPDFVMSMKDENGTIQPAIYDHDDINNPGTMPANYDPGKDPTWKGLYLPTLSVTMPFMKALNNGKNVPVGVKNMIYDANGFTGVALAGNAQEPLIALGEGSLGGWYCSTEQLSLTFVQSSFTGGGLNGQVVLPIFKYTAGDNAGKSSVWPWTCTYTKDEQKGSSFQFVVSPKNDAEVDIWKAKLSIEKEGQTLKTLKNGQPNVTAITATYNDVGFNAKAVLNMTLSLNTGILVAPNMKVEGLTFQTNPPAGEDVFDPGAFTAGLNSPQRYIAGDTEESGLPLELKSVNVAKAASNKAGEYDINLTGGLNLTKISSLHAGATGYVRFRVGNKPNGRPDWDYVTTGINSASVNGSVGPMTVNGELELFGYNSDGDGDTNYGKGLKASLEVTVLGAHLGAGAKLEGYFGSKKDAQGWYRYWQVGGYAELPGVGVPIAPAINLRKFGGGAFNNMKMTLDTTAKGEPTGNIKFAPLRGGCGFQAAVGITTADGTAVGLTGRLSVGFNNCEGDLSLNNVTLDANAQLLVADKPLAEGRGIFSIDFVNNSPTLIAGNATLVADYRLGGFFASGHGELGLHIDLVNTDNFYVYLGKPVSDKDRVTMTFGLDVKDKNIFSLDFASYFFLGKAQLAGINKLPPSPYKVDEGLLKQLGYVGGSSVPKDALAFGAGMNFTYNDNFGPFYIDFTAQAGFDLLLRNGLTCAGDPSADPGSAAAQGNMNPGINGWYANGQLYAALDLELGIEIDMWFYSGRVEALKITAAALLEGGVVNPVWLHGSALLKYRVLGGRIKGSVKAEFWYQKNYRCVVAMQQPNPFASMPIISMVLPSGKDPVSTISPLYASFNYPIRTLIEVNDVDKDGNVLDTYRTFRLDFKPGQQFKLTPANGSVNSQYAQCVNVETGRLVLDQTAGDDFEEGSYNATFYRDAALIPNTSYSLTVGIQVYIKASNCVDKNSGLPNNCGSIQGNWAEYLFASKGKDGKLDKPASVNDTQTVQFITGDCNGTLTREGSDATVNYSFPFEGQRYFTVGDATVGYVEKTAISCCNELIKSDENFDLNVRFVPLASSTGGAFNVDNALMASKVNYDGIRVSYTIPAGLKKQMIYRIDVVRVPNDKYIQAQIAELEKQKEKARMAMIVAVASSMQPQVNTGFSSFTVAGSSSEKPTGNLASVSTPGTLAGQMAGKQPNLGNTPMPGQMKTGSQPSGNSNAVTNPMASGNLTASVKPGAGLGAQAKTINDLSTQYVSNAVEYQQLGSGKLGNTTMGLAVTATAQTDNSKVKLTPEEQAAQIKKKYEQLLYSYPFQTSRYNTLAEKLSDTQILSNEVKNLVSGNPTTDGYFVVPMQGKEGFDTYELEWETLKKGIVRPPLVLFRPDDAGNPWFNEFVKPTVDLINKLATATKSNGQKLFTAKGPAGQQATLEPVNYDQLMRSIMSFNWLLEGAEAPLTDQEIMLLSTKK